MFALLRKIFEPQRNYAPCSRWGFDRDIYDSWDDKTKAELCDYDRELSLEQDIWEDNYFSEDW